MQLPTSDNPTLLIGLGAFAERVLQLVAAPSADSGSVTGDAAGATGPDSPADLGRDRSGGVAARPTAAVIHAGDELLDQGPEPLCRALCRDAEEHSRRLLDIALFIDTTAPADARGPRLDVFVIGDLGDPRVAAAVPDLVEMLAKNLRAAFRPILGAGQGALAVCPLLVSRRPASGDMTGQPDPRGPAVHALAALARHPDLSARPQARIYIIEDQSGKYLVPAEELARSLAAFLSLVLMSRLRDDSGMRDLVEDSGDDRAALLATFACATLEIDMPGLHLLSACRLAADLLDRFSARDLSLTEIAGEAQPLVPEPTTVASFLSREGSERSLEEYLEPPRLPVPDILWDDSPETIVERKFGPAWRIETAHAIEQFRDDVERFKMDRLASRIEENGTELATRVERDLMDRIHAHIAAGPDGPERALEFARYAATRARGLRDHSKSHMDAPDLRDFPPSPLESGVAAIDRAAAAWPRAGRVRVFAALAALFATFIIASLVQVTAESLGQPLPWWLSAPIGAIAAVSMIRYTLWAHRKRHHNWLVQARNDLDAALQRHLRDDLVDYFRRRLEYTRALWTYRIYRHIADSLDRVVRELEAARAAVAEARRSLAARARDLVHQRTATARSGILYRSVLDPDTADSLYPHIRPPDLNDAASRYHAHALGRAQGQEQSNAAGLDASYADPQNALAFALRELAHVSDLSPYEDTRSPLSEAVAAGVERYLSQLAVKLAPPLELVPGHAPDVPAARRILIAPPPARPLVERVLHAHNLDSGWDIRSVSADTRRIHLLVESAHIPLAAVAMAAAPSSTDTPTGNQEPAS